MSEWIYSGRLVRQSLFLIMERSKRPLALTAGKFIDLSLMSLMAVNYCFIKCIIFSYIINIHFQVLKSAGSYAAVLRQMTQK